MAPSPVMSRARICTARPEDAPIVRCACASFSAVRATSSNSWPCLANLCASAKPMPSDPPVITVIGRSPSKADSAAGSRRHQRLRHRARSEPSMRFFLYMFQMFEEGSVCQLASSCLRRMGLMILSRIAAQSAQ